MNKKQPGWRDECVSVLRTLVEREEAVARNSYAEYDGPGRPFKFTARCGEKRVENREWPTSYRGPLLIHAGKSREWLDDE